MDLELLLEAGEELWKQVHVLRFVCMELGEGAEQGVHHTV